MKRKYDIPAWKQVHFLRLALRHPETTKADCAVLGEIVQRYHGEYGNAWSSHEMLIEDTGVSRPSVIRAKKKLERLGFVSVLSPGRRGRSTVYKPNFDMVPEKGVTRDTETKGITDDTELDALGIKDDTETGLLGVMPDTPSYLHVPADKAGIHERYIDPSAPPLAGLSAASAGENGEGEKSKFDELYKAYGHRRNRADARKAYEALEPDAEDHVNIVAAAHSWREGWERQNNPDAPRITLAKWLEQERFHEDPPTGFKAKERKPPMATVKHDVAAPEPKKQAIDDPTEIYSYPGKFDAVITGSNIINEAGECILVLNLDLHNTAGTRVAQVEHQIFAQAFSKFMQDQGQAHIKALTEAAGLREISDTSELHGLRVPVTISKQREVTYHHNTR
ncbi:helix-turn-helix domain-containing protein [Brucella rhizosphaerae]|uniref:helix-turn-helix domain-containing protein n=1 Tax=Brucella rhizosphaerae TaxID=571254 RepID=UPI00046562C2|nr:helix-turn-helix domain-containing protein [Brucella rhizosphaerae]